MSALAEVLHNPERLAALEATGVLDSEPEACFDRFTQLVRKILYCPVVLISFVDKDRQFFKSADGLPQPYAARRQTPLSHSFCQYVVFSGKALVIEDARRHPLVQNNLAIRDLGVVAYLGMPLTTAEGQTLGSLCAIDVEPHHWTDKEIAILQDIAASVVTEIELRTLAKMFQANYLHLRKLEIQRDELVHMLVHDLRNPLSSLLGGLDLLNQAGELDDEQKECLALANTGGELLLCMINDILDISKSEAGRLEINRSEEDAAEIALQARDQVAQLATTLSVVLKMDLPEHLPSFMIDAGKTVRVLVNLLANAIQHTPSGGKVTLAAQVSEGAMVFSVTDNGCGISPEARAFIFEKFGQTKAQSSGRTSSGLGLPFCKMVVEAHGGKITVESELGKGTVFRLAIPCAPSANH